MRSLNPLKESIPTALKVKAKRKKITQAKAEFDKSIVFSMKETAAKPQAPEFPEQIWFKGENQMK